MAAMSLKNWAEYRRAYSGHPFWPLELLLRRRASRRVAVTAARLMARGRVLDVGAGPGFLALEVARTCPGVSVVAVDIAPGLISDGVKRARAGRISRLSFVRADVGYLPFATGAFEMTVSMFSLHQWSNPQKGLGEMSRVLKPQGLALILVGRRNLLRGLENITDYFTLRSFSNLKAWCLFAGFSQAEIRHASGVYQIIATK